MQDRRGFIRTVGGTAAATLAAPFFNPLLASDVKTSLRGKEYLNPEDFARDEDFWATVSQAFISSPNLLNLNNGGVSPQPVAVQDAIDRYNRMSNEAPAYYMWRTLGNLRDSVRSKLANLAGTKPSEIAIVRNSTEALEALILGLDLNSGDEFLTTDQDYPNMMNALHQRERREGIVIKKIKVPVPTTSLDEITRRYEEAITPRTKAILMCHVINLTGHIQPVRAVADIARRRGIPLICDGAHSFAALDFKIPDLGADYYGTSLHKWLCAPFGSGMLYVKEDKIGNVWSLFGSPEEDKDKIAKFEHIGTRSFPIELGIGHAIDFHNQIGSVRKEARLRYLKDYWAQQVKVMPGVFFNTSLKREHSCGIANFGIEGMEATDLAGKLLRDYDIFTVAIDHEDVKGIRVSPHIYTTLKDLDRFVEAVDEIARA